MDPEHRQELKESDLERFIRNFGPWWQKHGTTVLLAIAACLLAFVVVRYFSTRAERARETAYTQLAEARSPAALQDVAREHEGVPGLAGRALLEAADMKLSEVLVGSAGSQGAQPGGASSLSPEERTESLEQAAELYKRVIEQTDSKLLKLNARLGRAAALESLGRFEEARKQYEAIQKGADEQYPALAQRAGSRLSNLDRIQEPIEFPEPPKSSGGQGLQGGNLPADLLNMPDLGGSGESSSGEADGGAAPASGESGGDGGSGPSLLDIPAPSDQPSGDPSGNMQQDSPQPNRSRQEGRSGDSPSSSSGDGSGTSDGPGSGASSGASSGDSSGDSGEAGSGSGDGSGAKPGSTGSQNGGEQQ